MHIPFCSIKFDHLSDDLGFKNSMLPKLSSFLNENFSECFLHAKNWNFFHWENFVKINGTLIVIWITRSDEYNK